MSETTLKHSAMTALVMVAFAAIGTLFLAETYTQTKAPIAKSEAEAKLIKLHEVLPTELFDNNLLQDTLKVSAGGDLGNKLETLAYRARLKGEDSAVVLEATAPDGYSGAIKLLIAIKKDGTLAGVRVVLHKETPGLGDYIDIAHDNWIKHFDGESLSKTADEKWKVKKDGGQFDYMAGATITPRAVVKAVHKALMYYQAHQAELFAKQ